MKVANDILSLVKGICLEKNPGFFQFCSKRRPLFKFSLVGIFTSILDLVGLFFFHKLLHLPIVSATTLAFIFSFLLTFRFHKHWTFQGVRTKSSQYTLYIANIFACLNFNALLMHFLVNKLGIWYLVSQLAVNLTIGLYNFLIYRFVIFKPNDSSSSKN